MTAPADRPDVRGQRVSDETLRTAGAREIDDLHPRLLTLDLREARATITAQAAEIEALRKALATARQEGWIAGRDASLKACIYANGDVCRDAISALAPAAAEGDAPTDKCEHGIPMLYGCTDCGRAP